MCTRTTVVVLVALVVWQGQAVNLSADCVRLRMSLEDRLKAPPLVFVADVLSIENVLQPESYRYRVRFRVIETYRGIEAGEQVVQFRPSAEDFKFEVSQRVLVYAGGTRDNYSTQCSPTRVVTLEDAELQKLRELTRKQVTRP
jgi:hypothetical protein